jgi:hypothetical protein
LALSPYSHSKPTWGHEVPAAGADAGQTVLPPELLPPELPLEPLEPPELEPPSLPPSPLSEDVAPPHAQTVATRQVATSFARMVLSLLGSLVRAT